MADSVRDAVEKVVGNVLRDAGRDVPEFKDESHLADHLKLDSLDFAVVVVGLERELGVDPFRSTAPRVRTFGELVQLYQNSDQENSSV